MKKKLSSSFAVFDSLDKEFFSSLVMCLFTDGPKPLTNVLLQLCNKRHDYIVCIIFVMTFTIFTETVLSLNQACVHHLKKCLFKIVFIRLWKILTTIQTKTRVISSETTTLSHAVVHSQTSQASMEACPEPCNYCLNLEESKKENMMIIYKKVVHWKAVFLRYQGTRQALSSPIP